MRSLRSYKSHPDKLLSEHLQNVARLSKDTIEDKCFDSVIDKAVLGEVSYLIGYCHDFGKATPFFQEYINENDEFKKAKLSKRLETHHGLLSAIFTYHILKDHLAQESTVDSKVSGLLPVMGYLIVKKHHGNLKDVSFEILDLTTDGINEMLERQVESLELDLLESFWPQIHGFKNKFQEIVQEIKNSRFGPLRGLKEEDSPFIYLLTQLLYSILLNSDKQDASGLSNKERVEIDTSLIDNYRLSVGFNKPKSEMNMIRNQIYTDVMSKVNSINLDEKIYSLNVPTGTGKTLTSLSFALQLRDRLKKEKGFTPKIIYSLPFLSIIDQNFDVFEDVFIEVSGKKPTTDMLLKHHHLSEVFYQTDENEFEPHESQFLIEGWNSEIVVTTFFQFFHTLISNRNRGLRKFHNIINSIVILDEVQSIPHKYWFLLKELLKTLSEKFNTYFIFVTATQPLIFGPDEIVELVDSKDRYFKMFDRIQLIPNLEPLHITEFKGLVEDEIKKSEKDFLIVLNTIKASKEIFDHISSLDLEDVNLYYLSTNIIPKERLDRIKKIKTDDKRKIIVSTQLIEAGVDIDVAVVFRDFAPLDSINQVAGRCNRNYVKDEKGLVKVFILKDDNKNFYRYIYSDDVFLIEQTKEILKDNPIVDEKQFLEFNNRYFLKIKELGQNDQSKKILKAAIELEFKSLQEFRLIEEDYPKVDIFVERDSKAKILWDEYNKIKKNGDPLQRKKNFLVIKKDFYDYVISVPEKKGIADFDEDVGMGYISLEELKDRYSPETGFIPYESGGSFIT
jgi:CRISPR-associated endonuclease/helicase Cas3